MFILTSIALPRAARLPVLSLFVYFGRWCARCCERAEQRRALAKLDERMLKDIGLTRLQAAEESARPWWRD